MYIACRSRYALGPYTPVDPTKVPTRHKLHALSNNCVKFYENPSFKIYGVIYTYANLEGLCQFEQVLLYTSTRTESYW